MAISGGDGSIILTTKVDTSGINKGSLSIRSALQSVDTTVKKVQNSFSAFREQKVTLATLNQAIKDQTYVLKSLKNEHAKLVAAGKGSSTQAKQLKGNIEALTAEMKEMQSAAQTLGAKGSTSINKIGIAMKTLLSYFIGIQTIFKVINFSGEAAQFATQTEASVQRLIDIYGEAAQSVSDFIDANARAIGMSKASASSFASVYGNLFSVWADQSTNAELTNRYLNMTAVVASKTGRTVQDVQERIRSGLLGNTEAIEDLGVFVNVKTIEMTDAFQRMADGKSWEQLDAYTQQQVRTMAILEQATAKYGNTVADTTATTRAQYQAAYEDFKNTWGQVVNTVLIPVLKILTQVFTIATKGLQVIAGLTGKTIETNKLLSNQEKSIGGAVDNQEALTDAVKGTNKELKKSLAGYDEINILSQDTAESGGTGATGISGGVGGIGDIGGSYDNSFVDQIDSDLAAIMGYVGFALAAIGVILICFGHIGWGIGFLIAGAAIFTVSQAALSEGAELEKVKNIMNGVIAGISLLALILGIILVATGGSLPLGIGLIIVGAAGLATEVTLNWNYITETITNFFQKNAGLIVGVSIALIVLGIILLFTGVGIPLAIGLIVAGGGALAATVALNWNFIVDKVKEVWGKVKEFWNTHIAPIFTAEWWKNLGKKVMNGLIAGFESGINGIIGMFEKMINWIVNGLNKISFDVPDWVPGIGGKTFGFNIPAVKFDRVSIPRLAKGAVIPPNREFMAVLGDQKQGTNIETPESLLREIYAEGNAETNALLQQLIQVMQKGMTVNVDGKQLMRINREAETRVGRQTVTGGFANAY